MIIEYKNIRFKFSEVNIYHSDSIGSLNAYIPDWMWDKYKEFCTLTCLKDKVPYDETDLNDDDIPYSLYIRKLKNSYEVTSADVYICFISWLFDKQLVFDENVYIECQYDNISWLFHDIFHAENHTETYDTIMVQTYDEYEALHFGLEEGAKYCTYTHEFLESLEGLFKNRFSRSYNSSVSINLVDSYFRYEDESETEQENV